MKEILLLKDGEIVLKGLNRRQFEDVLKKNIRIALHELGKFEITSAQSTITVKPLSEDIDLDTPHPAGCRSTGSPYKAPGDASGHPGRCG